jgi:hypothetical protein
MPVDSKALLALWKTDEIPACDEGMELTVNPVRDMSQFRRSAVIVQ